MVDVTQRMQITVQRLIPKPGNKPPHINENNQKFFALFTTYALTPNTVRALSLVRTTSLRPCSPHRTPIAGTELRKGSLQALLALRYCCTVTPDGPPVARNCPV